MVRLNDKEMHKIVVRLAIGMVGKQMYFNVLLLVLPPSVGAASTALRKEHGTHCVGNARKIKSPDYPAECLKIGVHSKCVSFLRSSEHSSYLKIKSRLRLKRAHTISPENACRQKRFQKAG